MQEQEFELAVGDVLQLGDRLMTVIDIDGSEVSLRVDRVEASEYELEGHRQPVRPQK